MDKLQKHDYMQTIEQYLEENQVYELFEDLLKQIIVARPDKPLDYIIEAFQHPKCKQISPEFNSKTYLRYGSTREPAPRRCQVFG